jgi:hypothetical protein
LSREESLDDEHAMNAAQVFKSSCHRVESAALVMMKLQECGIFKIGFPSEDGPAKGNLWV